VIHVQGLGRSAKKLEVLRGVDFDVARGSIIALIGCNGVLALGERRGRA
jgi:ABC-2 type transport system ATP-binding protein